MAEIEPIGYEQDSNLAEICSRIDGNFLPIIKAEQDKAKWAMEVASRADRKRILNLQDVIYEALSFGALKLKKRSDGLMQLQGEQDYSSLVNVVRWFEDVYLPNLGHSQEPETVRGLQKKFYEEQKARLDKIEKARLGEVIDLEAAVYAFGAKPVVGLPVYVDYRQEDMKSLIVEFHDLVIGRLKVLGWLEEKPDQRSGRLLTVHITHKNKPDDVALWLKDLAESDYLRKQNLRFSVFDARPYLENRVNGYGENKHENILPIVNPDTMLTAMQAAQILGMSENGVRKAHYRDQLMVPNPDYDPKRRIGSRERIRYFYSGEKLQKFVLEHDLNAKCKFEGFNGDEKK